MGFGFVHLRPEKSGLFLVFNILPFSLFSSSLSQGEREEEGGRGRKREDVE